MNAATRPPLYAYEEAYKGKLATAGSYKSPQRRIRKFSDTEYNELVSLMSSASRATVDGQHNFNISTNQSGRLKSLLKSMGIVAPTSMTQLSGRLRLNYPITSGGVSTCTKDLNTVQSIIEGGPIVEYDGSNPLIAYNRKGERVYGITESKNYSNTVYHDEDTGNTRVVSMETAQLVEEKEFQEQQEKAKSDLFNYILAGVAILAVIVIIWFVKKNKK